MRTADRLAELVAAVAAVVRRYRLRSLLETPNTEVDLALRPRGALPCHLEPVGTPAQGTGEIQ